ncbi:hypothetical protein ABVK25_009897 [Lepraria finkii]|uniref:Uncharacterized protein n=1 Tax=Lepraria finkii TaxID=1340010 RepID=A0ABR4AXZ6_9LECA
MGIPGMATFETHIIHEEAWDGMGCNECIADEYNQPGILYRTVLGPSSSPKRMGKARKLAYEEANPPTGKAAQFSTFKAFFNSTQTVENKGSKHFVLTSSYEFDWLWSEVISEYSSGDLTVHTDRLVAIFGVASRIKTRTGFTYAAELWREFMHYNLLWGPEKPMPIYHDPRMYLAPS